MSRVPARTSGRWVSVMRLWAPSAFPILLKSWQAIYVWSPASII